MDRNSSTLRARSIPVGALTHLPEVMTQFGEDPWRLLAIHGVTRDILTRHRLTPLPIETHGRILTDAAARTRCDHLGLLLGQRASLENAGPLRFLVLNAGTAADALDAVRKYSPIWYRGIAASVTVDRGFASLSLSLDGVFPGREQLLTAYLAANARILALILGRAWRASDVRISHREPASSLPYRQFFNAPVRFNEARHEILFPEELLRRDVVGTDPQLRTFFDGHLRQLDDATRRDIVGEVRHAIEESIHTGECTIDKIAHLFSVHRITLYRHLASAGTTFETVLDRVRRDVAEQLLEQTDLPLVELSQLLGYRNQSTFTRAFHRWNETSPSRWRRGIHQEPSGRNRQTGDEPVV